MARHGSANSRIGGRVFRHESGTVKRISVKITAIA
jgi:hypothetical protein